MKFYNEISKEDFDNQMVGMVNNQLNANLTKNDVSVEVIVNGTITNFEKIRIGIEMDKLPNMKQ